MAPSLPGASGVVPALGARTSPTAPLTAEIVPSAGARRTVSSTSFCAAATAAWDAATSPRCCAISDGRSVEAESRLFCAVTRPCRAFSTWHPARGLVDVAPVLRRRPAPSCWPPPAARPASAPTGGWPPGSRPGSPTRRPTTRASRRGCPRPSARPRAASCAPPRSRRHRRRRSRTARGSPTSRPEVSTDALDGVPPDAPHAFSAWSNWSSMSSRRPRRSRAASSRAPRHSSASTVLAWSWVASRISPAWFVVFSRARHRGGVDHAGSARPAARRAGPAAARACAAAGASSTVASTSPGGDLLADLDVDGLELSALEKPEVLLGDRGQRAGRRDGGGHARPLDAGGRRGRGPDDVVQATSVPATSMVGTAIRRMRRASRPGPHGLAVAGARCGHGGDDLRGASTLDRPVVTTAPDSRLVEQRPVDPGTGDGALVSGTRDPPPGDEGGVPDDGGWGPATLRHPMDGTYKRHRGPLITGRARDVPVTWTPMYVRPAHPAAGSTGSPWIASV